MSIYAQNIKSQRWLNTTEVFRKSGKQYEPIRLIHQKEAQFSFEQTVVICDMGHRQY